MNLECRYISLRKCGNLINLIFICVSEGKRQTLAGMAETGFASALI